MFAVRGVTILPMLLSTLEYSLLPCLSRMLTNFPVMLAYLYGSTARGRATPLSDIDIALVVNKDEFDPVDRLKLELEIEEQIVNACELRQAEVRIINDAPIIFRGEVVNDGILLYSRSEEFRVDFETFTRSEYFDFLPVAALHREAYFERLRTRGFHG